MGNRSKVRLKDQKLVKQIKSYINRLKYRSTAQKLDQQIKSLIKVDQK